MAFNNNRSNANASNNNERSPIVGYSNTYLSGLKNGRKKIGAIKLYENNELAQFIVANKEQLEAGGKLTIVNEIVFVENTALELEDDLQLSTTA